MFLTYTWHHWQVFKEVYASILRPKLSQDAREFWDDNGDLIRDNFMFAGTSGLAAKLLVPALRFLGKLCLRVHVHVHVQYACISVHSDTNQ